MVGLAVALVVAYFIAVRERFAGPKVTLADLTSSPSLKGRGDRVALQRPTGPD
jgi:hypothetical protein